MLHIGDEITFHINNLQREYIINSHTGLKFTYYYLDYLGEDSNNIIFKDLIIKDIKTFILDLPIKNDVYCINERATPLFISLSDLEIVVNKLHELCAEQSLKDKYDRKYPVYFRFHDYKVIEYESQELMGYYYISIKEKDNDYIFKLLKLDKNVVCTALNIHPLDSILIGSFPEFKSTIELEKLINYLQGECLKYNLDDLEKEYKRSLDNKLKTSSNNTTSISTNTSSTSNNELSSCESSNNYIPKIVTKKVIKILFN